jgi:putative nucleotidyltransferase with HDIG domain
LIYNGDPSLPSGGLEAVLLLSALALVAEVLAFLLPGSARGSLAFIPYLAGVLLMPHWILLPAVGIVKGISERAARIEWRRTIFNVAVHVGMMAVAIWTYVGLGGRGLLSLGALTLQEATVAVGAAGLAATATAFILNSLCVSTVIALSAGHTISQVWKTTHFPNLGVAVLTGPVVFVFAWVYASFGPIAAVALWVPILGIRQVHKVNIELARTNEELLQLMVKSLEARDPYTSGHSRRVQQYSLTIARALGLSEREIELIGRAALLHDLGKIHEKYGPVLSKTDRLSAEDWAVVREHPGDGAELIATMSRLRDVVPAVRHHHEKWDGTGYPDGLAGELIPLSSRIITLADTIDAMTTERPYRRPLSEADVRAELVRCRGSQFDPALTDRLLSSPLWLSLFPPGSTDRKLVSFPGGRSIRTVGDSRAVGSQA